MSSGAQLARTSRCAAVRPARAMRLRVAAYKDAGPLRHAQETQLRHVLSTYNKAHAFFPKVKFVLKHNSRLGEVWKLCGSSPALGAWIPEVAPALKWSEGGIWSAEIALAPGDYTFKCILRCADGSYVWEAGDNRQLVVPVKDRAGHFVVTYHMDVRKEPVESLPLTTPGKYGPMRQGERLEEALLPLADNNYSNGRVLASAGARY